MINDNIVVIPNQNEGVIKLDPWLTPFADALKRRYSKAQEWIKVINENEGGFEKFSKVWKFAFILWFICFLTDNLTGHRHIRFQCGREK